MGVHLAGGVDASLVALEAKNPALLDPFIGDGGAALGWIGILSLLGWGLGYAGQPHILARFMAIRRVEEMHTARRVAMGWVVVVLVSAAVVGMTGLLVLDRPLVGADSEKVFIFMSTQLFHPVIAGICLSGILAAVMSTASAQLLVSSSAFAEDFYRGLVRPQAGKRRTAVGRARRRAGASRWSRSCWASTREQGAVAGRAGPGRASARPSGRPSSCRCTGSA